MKIVRSVFPGLIEEIKRPEVSILLGPRQVGKTFLLREIQRHAAMTGLRTRYYDLELPADLLAFNRADADIFKMLTKDVDVVFIDEFHYMKNASKIFKAIFDSRRKVKIFASGSSSIEMHKHIKESLAGRRLTTNIAPLSFAEYGQKAHKGAAPRLFEEYVAYGGLPGLLHAPDAASKIRILSEILAAYIQKDVKGLVKEENIRAFNNLIYLLAENQGSLISENSLAREIGLTAATVNRHLSILDKTYVCHAVHSYARNLGNELKKSKKVYFYDLGIRNALLKDFGVLSQRGDKGAIYESFVFLQLVCALQPNEEIRFWRNKAGQEIDFVLLQNRRPFLIEVKSTLPNREAPQAMKIFLANYPETSGAVIFSEDQEGETEHLGKPIRFVPLTKATDEIRTIMSLTQ